MNMVALKVHLFIIVKSISKLDFYELIFFYYAVATSAVEYCMMDVCLA
uniref:Uncharacterized protein n=1 Tax=Arundo donax TaxID=35708 RepID=A0A0A9HBP8_ARUDO